MAGRIRIEVARERYKFSCAHMTIFPDGTKERLHGHNFAVKVAMELRDASFRQMVDFGPIKNALQRLCDEWKEHTLLPGKNPHVAITRQGGGEVEFLACKQRYVLPAADVIVLPVENVTVEGLAQLAAERFFAELHPELPADAISALEVTVEETPGQGATVTLPWAAKPRK